MLRAAQTAVPEGWTLVIADISDLPVFNDDLNNDKDRPNSVKRFKEQVQGADAILISSPEHNYGVATATKNALDWASTKPNCWDDKV
jgi:chromate reductase